MIFLSIKDMHRKASKAN